MQTNRTFCQKLPQQAENQCQLIDLDIEKGNEEQYIQKNPQNHIAQMKAVLAQMSLDEKAKMAQQMGAAEDFPTA